MKKIIFIFFVLIMFIVNINASTRKRVELNKCIDGDTASFIFKNEIIKARFLAIDTPETKHPKKEIEPYGLESSNYTCNMLKNANIIEFEFDDKSDIKDKYNRYLVWIFVDDKLLQEKLIEKGLAKVEYIYGNYKYVDLLKEKELIARTNNIGIWKKENNNNYTYIIIAILLIFIMCLLNKKSRKKHLKKMKQFMFNKFLNK